MYNKEVTRLRDFCTICGKWKKYHGAFDFDHVFTSYAKQEEREKLEAMKK